jgi:signal transduction histidine kinase
MDAAHFSIRDDLQSAENERSSVARNIARLEQDKAAAEQVTKRLLALQKMTVALSDATNQSDVAEIIIDHLGQMLEGCRPLIATYSPGREYVEYVHDSGPDVRNGFIKLPISTTAPITEAIRTKSPVIVDGSDEIQQRYPELPRPDSAQIDTIVAVPFVVDGHSIGGLSIRFSPTPYRGTEDFNFILHLAHTCTQSLERVRLHEAERAARAAIDTERRRLRLLAEASAVLNASLDASAITDALTHVIVPNFADFCVVHRHDNDGFPQVENVVHENPGQEKLLYRFVEAYPYRPEHPVVEMIRLGKTVFIEWIDESFIRGLTASEHQLYAELFHDIAMTSVIVVPMITRGETLGLLTFGTCKNRFCKEDVLFAEEIAHRAATALNNARLYHEAQEANRVKDEFLGVVSHELRTPLNAILGWARMLRTGAVRDGAQPRALEAIERNASHQARLIDDLLDASRITAGKLRLDATIVELGQVVESAMQSVLPGATAKGIRIHTTTEAYSIPVFADANRLQQIVWNLLSNAIKFTPKEGVIEVVVRREGDEAVVRVSDNGRGIRPELIPHIFERFRQGDGTLTRNSGGLGLGLSIVRHLVEAHGGTVNAESPGADMGATFTVRLPISRPKTITPPKPLPTVPKNDIRKLTGLGILVIDDEPDAREILEEVLTLAGATIKTAADAGEALRILSDFIPDVIISDLAMPGEDGLSLMRKIRARAPDRVANIPAIALTAYTRTEDRVQALNAGFQLHVPKPVDPTELVATVASLRTLLVG